MADIQVNKTEPCFCELAPLYAIGALNQDERRWVEAQVESFPELAAELEDYEAAVELMPYCAPSVTIHSDLKARLLHRIAESDSPPIPNAALPSGNKNQGRTVRSENLRWRSYHAPGIQIANLHIDRMARKISCMIRAEAGAQYPAHRHAGIEEIVMIEGDLCMAGETYRKGDYIRSEAMSIHPTAETAAGCIFFLQTSLNDELRN